MISVMIFIPQYVLDEDNCLLYGSCELSSRHEIATFYILQFQRIAEECHPVNLMNIGQFRNDVSEENVPDCMNLDWLLIENRRNNLFVKKLVVQGETMHLSPQKIIFITYDMKTLVNTELLHFNSYSSEIKNNENYFKTLMCSIKHSCSESSHNSSRSSQSKLIVIAELLVALLNHFLVYFALLLPLFKFSSLCIRVHDSLEGLRWVLCNYISKRKVTLKIGNYVTAALADIISGYIILLWFTTLVSSTLPSQLVLNSAEDVVQTLQELLKWLMGIPAGLKLNFAFNNMLGKFFLYHINLWWTFLVLAEPVLDLIFSIFLCFGRLGLTYQAAILADLLALATFHVYCIYVYAARLYNLQISGLLALWRLFLGRKKNPLRGRVDSCEYTPNQLFIGTLAFTVLLFLLPTTFMYYVVFATLRLFVAVLAGLLTRVQFLLQALPLYTTSMWLLKHTLVSSSLQIQLQTRKPGIPLVLSMQPVRGSLWKTIQNSIADPVKKPSCILWGSLLKNVVTGQLIYPM